MLAMKSTIAKMLNAHTSMTAENAASAVRPLPRARRNSRIAEGGLADTGNGEAAMVTGTESGIGDDFGWLSRVMRLEGKSLSCIPIGTC